MSTGKRNGQENQMGLDCDYDLASLSQKVSLSLEFLNKSCSRTTGFQNTCLGTSRTTLVEEDHPAEIFTSLMALDLLFDCLNKETLKALHTYVTPKHLFKAVSFFKHNQNTPDDVEDTSLVHYLFYRDGFVEKSDEFLQICRLVLANTNQDGVIELYIPPRENRENRLDPSCMANCLRFIYAVGYGVEALKTEDYLCKWLEEDEHLTKVLYYPSPDTLPYFLSRAVVLCPRAKKRFEGLLLEKIKKRIGSTQFPMDLAMRILALDNLGLLGQPIIRHLIGPEVTLLLSQQDASGSFPKDALFRKGRSETYFGGEIISTILGVAAIRAYQLNVSTASEN